MRSSIALFAFAAALVSGQSQNYTSELDMKIDPGSVTQQQRASWCKAQTDTCDTLCDNNTNKNDCTQSDLSWACTCSSNSSAPGLQYYTQTVPTFICNELFNQCIAQNVGSQKGQDACKTNILNLCATYNPPSGASSSGTTTKGTASATATSSKSGSSATGSVTTTSSKDFAAPTMVPLGKGAVALAVGVFAYLV